MDDGSKFGEAAASVEMDLAPIRKKSVVMMAVYINNIYPMRYHYHFYDRADHIIFFDLAHCKIIQDFRPSPILISQEISAERAGCCNYFNHY